MDEKYKHAKKMYKMLMDKHPYLNPKPEFSPAKMLYPTGYGDDKKSHTMKSVTGASIVIADYDLIRTDIEYFKGMTNEDIDKQLLETLGVISSENANYEDLIYKDVDTSTFKKIENKKYNYYRPLGYGRAVVFHYKDSDIKKDYFMDAKGVGVGRHYTIAYGSDNSGESADIVLKNKKIDINKSHSDGTMTMSDALREYYNERAVRKILENSSYARFLKLATVKSYAIINLGMMTHNGDNAAIYIRQSFNRKINLYSPDESIHIQSILSWFGMSTYNIGGVRIMTTSNSNIQGDKNLPLNNDNLDKITAQYADWITGGVSSIRDSTYLLDFGSYYFRNKEIIKREIVRTCVYELSLKLREVLFECEEIKCTMRSVAKIGCGGKDAFDKFLTKIEGNFHYNSEISSNISKIRKNKKLLDRAVNKATIEYYKSIIKKDIENYYHHICQYILMPCNKVIPDNESNEKVINVMQDVIKNMINDPDSPWFQCNVLDSTLIAETRFLSIGNISKKIIELDKLFRKKIESCDDNNRCCEILDINRQYMMIHKVSERLTKLMDEFDYSKYIETFANIIGVKNCNKK